MATVTLPVSVTNICENAFLNSGIKSIQYTGTKSKWGRIAIASSGNTDFLNATVTGSDGNRFSANKNKWSTGTTNTVIKPSVSKVKSFKAKAGKKKLTLSWKKVSGIDGYQIQISTRKNFKGAKQKAVLNSKKKCIVKGLKSKKKYYVRIRAFKVYRDTNGNLQTVYGSWNTVNKKTK